MAGRPKLPTQTKKDKGTYHPGRDKGRVEPKPPIQTPSCPDYLDATARLEWKRIVPLLEQMRLLSLVDRTALAMYCESHSQFVRASKKLTEEGEVIITSTGFPVPSPWMAIKNKAKDYIHKFLTEFGMSPASRTKVNVAEPSEEDQVDEFIRSRNDSERPPDDGEH